MPRQPRQIDVREKETAQRHYIIEGEELPSHPKVYAEGMVVKEFDRVNTSEDNWAIHELKEVTAVDQDGNIANLLFCAKLGHTFKVRGQIFVDQDYVKYCKSSTSC